MQLSRPSFTRDSPELVQAIQQDTDLQTASMNFAAIVPTRGMNRRLLIAFAVAAIWIAYMFVCAPGAIALFERVFLIPAKVPRKTEVICLTGDKTIPAGESVLLEAQARGFIPSHGRVTLTDDDKRVLYNWSFSASVASLKAGQTVNFATRLSSPPNGARHLQVRLAEIGK